jgi:hypothetical protein
MGYRANRMPSSLPPIEPLVIDNARVAADSMRGSWSQIWRSVLVWLDLDDDERLFLEGAEDFDRVGPKGAETVQVKDTKGNFTLRSHDVLEAIGHAWEHRQHNSDIAVRFRFLSTGGFGVEQGSPFGEGIGGLQLWLKARASIDNAARERDARNIANFLVAEGKLPKSLQDFISGASDKTLWTELIAPVDWDLRADSTAEIIQEVKDRLVILGSQLGVSPDLAEFVAEHLYAHTYETATLQCNRSLNRAALLRLFHDKTRRSVPAKFFDMALNVVAAQALKQQAAPLHSTEAAPAPDTRRSPTPAPCLRICVAAAGKPIGRPLNLLMILTARRLPAIAVIVGVDPRALHDALQTALELAREVNAQVLQGRGAAAGTAQLPLRTWTVSKSPTWPTADGARGLIWSPQEGQPWPTDLTEALRGARWGDDIQAGDLLVIALSSGGEEAILALAQMIRDRSPAAPHSPQLAIEVPVYAWSRVRLDATEWEADIQELEAKMPALARLRRILDRSGAPADQSQTVEYARAMRLYAEDGPSPVWRRASREAIELHDLSLLTQLGGRVERPSLSECAIAADVVGLAAQNEAIIATLPFLPVARPVLESLLQPANGLARLALGLVSGDEMRRERIIGNVGRISGVVPAPEALFFRVAAGKGRDIG